MTVMARRHPAWIAAVAVCLVVIVGLFAEVGRRGWQELSGEIAQARSERQGVRYLHPMISLVGELVEAQSAAVRGNPLDATAVRTAMDGVATVDAQVGADLGVRQRFADLRAKVEVALAEPGSGRPAYLTFSDIVALAVDLLHRAGGNSELIHQEGLDAYYVMDAVMFRLPEAIVLSGRTADLVALAGDQQLAGDDSIRAAVARFGVATAGEEVTAGLNKSVDSTERTELGTNVAARLDAFRAAVDAFAPPTMVAQLAGTVDAAQLARGAEAVFTAALPLAHRLLSELDGLLGTWEDELVGERQFIGVAMAVAAGTILLLLLLVRRRRRPDEQPGSTDDARTEAVVADVRRLFAADELAAAGTATSARPTREHGDAG